MDVAWLWEGKMIDLHSMELWGYYEVDLHHACIPFDYNLIALGFRVCWPSLSSHHW